MNKWTNTIICTCISKLFVQWVSNLYWRALTLNSKKAAELFVCDYWLILGV